MTDGYKVLRTNYGDAIGTSPATGKRHPTREAALAEMRLVAARHATDIGGEVMGEGVFEDGDTALVRDRGGIVASYWVTAV